MATAPYPLLSDVLNKARSRVNDQINGAGGQTLKNSSPFTGSIVNLAYERLQQFLVGLGYTTLEASVIIAGLPPAATNDPNVEVSLSWTGYFNGATLNTTIALPQNLIRPMKEGLQQRPSVAGASVPVLGAAVMNPMDEILGELAHVPKSQWMDQWQWRGDAIVMIGALVPVDLRIRYNSYLPALDPNSGTQTVPIMRCEDALSAFIAVEFSGARGDPDRVAEVQEAEQVASVLAAGDNVDSRLSKASERRKMKDRYSRSEAAPAA